MGELYWRDVEKRRKKIGISKVALSVRSGIRENTMYSGIKHDRRLQPSTASIMRKTLVELEFET